MRMNGLKIPRMPGENPSDAKEIMSIEHRKLRSLQDGQLLLRPEKMNIYLGQKLKSNGIKP